MSGAVVADGALGDGEDQTSGKGSVPAEFDQLVDDEVSRHRRAEAHLPGGGPADSWRNRAEVGEGLQRCRVDQ